LTSVVSYALGIKKPATQELVTAKDSPSLGLKESIHAQFTQSTPNTPDIRRSRSSSFEDDAHKEAPYNLFTRDTISIVYGMQPRAVQNMLGKKFSGTNSIKIMFPNKFTYFSPHEQIPIKIIFPLIRSDFDHCCGRKKPSVVAMVYPFSGNHFQKFYWGSSETLIPVYQKLSECILRHPNVEVMVNFASFRSVYESVTEAFEHPQIKTIAIIAEGVPENHTKSLIRKAKSKGVTLIGPATVGGIKPGAFRYNHKNNNFFSENS
jgi:hypothetical protein